MFPFKNSLVIFSLIVFTCGCGKPATAPKVPVTLTQAQEHFLKICKEELKYDVYIYPSQTGKSMWVYVPLNETMIGFRPADENTAPKAETLEKWSIHFLESLFDPATKTLSVRYDIGPAKQYDAKAPTYQNKYSDEYSAKQREVLTALTRAYFDVGSKHVEVPMTVGDDHVKIDTSEIAEKLTKNPLKPVDESIPPEFFVLVFADPKSGVGIKSISNFQDMKKALSNPPSLTNEEFAQRYIYELFGDKNLIGDTTGTRLNAEEVELGYFLSKQIENRIKYQFTQSSFPPKEEIRDAIWNIVAETFRAYEFKNFEKIKLIDLNTKEEATYDKSQLFKD